MVALFSVFVMPNCAVIVCRIAVVRLYCSACAVPSDCLVFIFESEVKYATVFSVDCAC